METCAACFRQNFSDSRGVRGFFYGKSATGGEPTGGGATGVEATGVVSRFSVHVSVRLFFAAPLPTRTCVFVLPPSVRAQRCVHTHAPQEAALCVAEVGWMWRRLWRTFLRDIVLQSWSWQLPYGKGGCPGPSPDAVATRQVRDM